MASSLEPTPRSRSTAGALSNIDLNVGLGTIELVGNGPRPSMPRQCPAVEQPGQSRCDRVDCRDRSVGVIGALMSRLRRARQPVVVHDQHRLARHHRPRSAVVIKGSVSGSSLPPLRCRQQSGGAGHTAADQRWRHTDRHRQRRQSRDRRHGRWHWHRQFQRQRPDSAGRRSGNHHRTTGSISVFGATT